MRICTSWTYHIKAVFISSHLLLVDFMAGFQCFLLSGRAVNAGPCRWGYWFMSGVISLDAKIEIQTGRGGDSQLMQTGMRIGHVFPAIWRP
jgi:hypothetical protein